MPQTQTKGENKEARSMPFNIEAEQALLCSVLIDKTAADEYLPRLLPDDFYSERNRIIFETAKEILDESIPVDTVSLADRLSLKGKLDAVGSVSYITELTSIVPSSANCEYYYKIVKRDGLLRQIINVGVEVSKKGYSATDEIEALNFAESTIFKIAEDRDNSSLIRISGAANKAVDEIAEIQKGHIPTERIETGIPTLDKHTFGFKPGELILLAARPSVGKTAFALNIATNAAINDHKRVAIFSMEMPATLLAKRILSYISGVSMSDASRPRGLSNEEMSLLYKAAKKLDSAEIYIDDYSLNTPVDILSKCRRLKREKGLDLIVIDYLQLMSLGYRGSERQQEVADMSRKLKLYAGELKVPILALSQMSRDVEKRTGSGSAKDPKLSDLRDSGAIEQDADVVMFLHRPDPADLSQVRLMLLKNRNGAINDNIMLHWDGNTTSFTESQNLPPVSKRDDSVSDVVPISDAVANTFEDNEE
ncbi:MAG: replicative DNA helicase [Christensenellales bacterium]